MAYEVQRRSDQELKAVLNAIPGMVLGRDMGQFNQAEYQESLVAYTGENRVVFEQLQHLCEKTPERSEEMQRLTCHALLDAIERNISEPHNNRLPGDRALRFDNYKMVIVTYLTPAIQRMGMQISEDFVRTLREEWLVRYPKHPFLIVTGEMIAEGFNRKWYQCYITQAVCHYLKKTDDCYELTAFRRFRDTYLAACPDGPALIAEYYRNAPGIVARIELSGEGERIYPELWEKDLLPCLREIEGGRPANCKDRYVTMMHRLQNRFLCWSEEG